MALGLGINLAFYDYGTDFGPELVGRGRPSWRLKVNDKWSPGDGTTPSPKPGTPPPDDAYAKDGDDVTTTKLYQDLKFLRKIGVDTVRWYLLGDGMIFAKSSYEGSTQDPLAAPEQMPPIWTGDFLYALSVFKAAGMQMVPVFLDFLFAQKPKVIFNGREYVVPFRYFRDAKKNGVVQPKGIIDFVNELKQALGSPALSITGDPTIYLKGGRSDWLLNSKTRGSVLKLLTSIMKSAVDKCPGVVRAWELMSEPDMACTDHDGANGDVYVLARTSVSYVLYKPWGYGYKTLPVQRQTGTKPFYEGTALDEFLCWALGKLAKTYPDEKFTIGFHSAEALASRFTGPSKSVYRGLAKKGKFIPAFHYYPENLAYTAERIENDLTGIPYQTPPVYARKLKDVAEVLKGPLQGATELFVGEFATKDDYQGMQPTTWPDIDDDPKWGGAAMLARLGAFDIALGKLGPKVTLMPWAYANGGDRSYFTLRHAAAIATYSGAKEFAALLNGLEPDGPDPPH